MLPHRRVSLGIDVFHGAWLRCTYVDQIDRIKERRDILCFVSLRYA